MFIRHGLGLALPIFLVSGVVLAAPSPLVTGAFGRPAGPQVCVVSSQPALPAERGCPAPTPERRAEYSLSPSDRLCYRLPDDSGGYCRHLPYAHKSFHRDVIVIDRSHSQEGRHYYAFGGVVQGQHYEGCEPDSSGERYSCRYRAENILVTRKGSDWQMIQGAGARWARDFSTMATCLKSVRNLSAPDIVNNCS